MSPTAITLIAQSIGHEIRFSQSFEKGLLYLRGIKIEQDEKETIQVQILVEYADHPTKRRKWHKVVSVESIENSWSAIVTDWKNNGDVGDTINVSCSPV